MIFNLLTPTIAIIIYYRYIKAGLIQCAAFTAKHSAWWKNVSFEEKKGVYELSFIALSHLVFCIIMMKALSISFYDLGWALDNPLLILYGTILGIAEMGFSMTLCMLAIRLSQCENSWAVLTRAGWIRHHFHTIKLLPRSVALVIIFLQLSAEEIFFRGIMLNALFSYSQTIAATASISLFIYMQTFHMPSKITALFPVIGALVLGITHTLLYFILPSLLPLIVAHLVFFVSAVLI